MNATTWPLIRKSAAMRSLEVANKDENGDPSDIRDILIDVLTRNDTDKAAAAELGIDNTTLSTWLVKLRIDEHARAIRGERYS